MFYYTKYSYLFFIVADKSKSLDRDERRVEFLPLTSQTTIANCS